MTTRSTTKKNQDPQLVIDSPDAFQVSREVFVSEDILRRERQEIFDRCWTYVGHESELANPGDFIARNVAGRPVIFAKGRGGNVKVLLNSCRHRGAKVCRAKRGNSRIFTCFYHGWSYDNTGALVAVPDAEAYGPDHDRSSLGLVEPAKVESYRGFYFATFDADSSSLHEYLADARYLLDLVVDQSPDGLEVLPSEHHYSMRANWKLLMENTVDDYHGPVHQTYFEMAENVGASMPAGWAASRSTQAVDLGNGHAVASGLGFLTPFITDSVRMEAERCYLDASDRYGEHYASDMLKRQRNMNIFPNLSIVDLLFGIQIRTIYPIAPDHTVITGWQFIPKGLSDDMRRYRLENARAFWGPAGMATPDDVEALEQCQDGYKTTQEVAYNDVSRGLRGEGRTGELVLRVFWRRWNELVAGTQGRPEGDRWDASSYPVRGND